MANYSNLTDLFTGIANAIRGKTGNSNEIIADNFPSKISEIVTVQEGTSDATASSSDILSGKTAYVNGSKVTGNITSKSASDMTVNGATVTTSAGYYANNTSKSVLTATQATPNISVNSSGVITASATQSAGYVSAGTKSATKQLTTKGATTIIPGTSNQTIASGTYLTGNITIAGDANLKSENIPQGVSIFGVAGTKEIPTAKIGVITTDVPSSNPGPYYLPFALSELTDLLPCSVHSGYIAFYNDGGAETFLNYGFYNGYITRVQVARLVFPNNGNSFTFKDDYAKPDEKIRFTCICDSADTKLTTKLQNNTYLPI